jgi:hypothetical protein
VNRRILAYRRIFKTKENLMKSGIAGSAFGAAVLLALTQVAAAQGPSGANGVAGIPGSVVRAGEDGRQVTQPGLISILTNPPPPNPYPGPNPTATRRGTRPTPAK